MMRWPLIAVATALLALPVAGGGHLIPPVALAQDARPVWVSEREAFEPDGSLRKDRFPESVRNDLDRLRALNGTEDCRLFSGSEPEIFQARDTTDALLRHSRVILAGDVVASEQGFLSGMPGTLYAVKVSRRVKTLPGFNHHVVHLFVNDARIVTSTGLICARNFSEIPTPKAGDRVLFFSYFDPFDANGTLFSVDLRTQLVVESHGRIARPKSLADLPSKVDWRALLSDLEARANRAPRKP